MILRIVILMLCLGDGVVNALGSPEATRALPPNAAGSVLEDIPSPDRLVPSQLLQPTLSTIDGLTDLDGRITTGVRPEELDDTIRRELLQKRCRLLSGALNISYGQVDADSQISKSLSLLVHCPQGAQFRFMLLQDGVPVKQARVQLVDATDSITPAYLSFTTPQGVPLHSVVYSSDGQPRAIALTAHLHRLPGVGSLAGELKLVAPLEFTLIAD